MAARGRPNDIASGISLRAVRLARRLGLRFMPIQEETPNLGTHVRNGNTSRETANGSGRNTRRNSHHSRHLDSDGNSDSCDEDYEQDEDSEDESDVCVEEEHCQEKMGFEVSHHHTDSEQAVVPVEHAIAQLTKLRTSPNKVSAKSGHVNREGVVPTLAMLSGREMNVSGIGRWSRAECCHVAARYLPVDGPKIIDHMNSRVYVGKFSSDGSLFVGGFQERHIRVYNVDDGWTIKKDILARQLRWTVTDTALSNDQRFLIYATISPIVHLVNIGNESCGIESLANITEIHEGLDFSTEPSGEYSLGLFSIQFSHDGREIVAGGNKKSIHVYDIEANKPVLSLQAHKEDVNAVAFADETCHLIYSGSDDHLCKVWDRRCIVSKTRPAGILVGHLEGITFIDTRGDGRYFISNGKDQTIKLWDIRKMATSVSLSKSKAKKVPSYSWDYRWMDYPAVGKDIRHPYDQSLMTYKGHQVLRTLIRCYFSPAFTTGQKYIYTGSHDGCVYIYDLITGKCVAKLSGFHRETVRDCSWHPLYPVLVSSAWDGVIAKWEHLHGDKVDSRDPRGVYEAGIPYNLFESD